MVDNQGKRVVYWIGAGASAQALPVVNEMAAAIAAQRSWMSEIIGLHPERRIYERYWKYLWKLIHDYTPYGTVDTYARSLFVQGRTEELAELKLHLTLFFLLEQINMARSRSNSNDGFPPYVKSASIDPRYMGLLALLVKENKGITNRVNFISWNYDVQVEMALARYWQLRAVSDVHSQRSGLIYPSGSLDPPVGSLPLLVHLNGVAGLSVLNKTSRFYYANMLNTPVKIVIESLFDGYGGSGAMYTELCQSMTESFTFAWENKTVGNTAIALAKKIMDSADILVIVGYSFPSFNRMVDRDLFHSFVQRYAERKYVVVQNPDMQVETFQKMMGIDGHTPNVHMERGLSQFHVPYDFF